MKSKIIKIVFLNFIFFNTSIFAMGPVPGNENWSEHMISDAFFEYINEERFNKKSEKNDEFCRLYDELSERLKKEPTEHEELRKKLEEKLEECGPTVNNHGVIHPAAIYKVHLQVKQQYLFEFVQKLIEELEKPELLNICMFRYASSPENIRHKPRSEGGKAIPIIVLYVTECVDFLDNQKRDNIIDPMITELISFIDNFCKDHNLTIQDLAWPVTPRFNKKINDVCYIAGGDGGYKPVPSAEDEAEYLKTGKYKKTTGRYIPYVGGVQYSDDLCFVKGHEYLTPAERVMAN